ncbi:SMI1/KNR4 family protein [Saccharophagus sp. K07]|uniref:SMI1/KNR4 family protein n=1 Tax=Saccharophagus sp. K07 TaxID=2283636 RepID=UPI001651E87B|nr:SMI1/KNR4 family protein [Saccharophagus sp. K07]MBC6907228.1 SMI1/KNR4 family protein [Saccharophagus sp. K07]
MIDVSHLTRLMENRGVARKSELIGVSDAEIQSLENHFSLTFPASYREFLRSFGRSAGFLSPWMAIYFDDLKEIREQFDCLVAAGNLKFHLPENALLIANWESVFDFIVCNETADPPVYRIDIYQTDRANLRIYAESYSEYLQNMIETADASALPSDFFEDETVEALNDTIHY